MKNKLITIILSGLMIFSLTGCIAKEEYKDSTPQVSQQNNRFQKTGEFYYIDDNKFEVVEDMTTKNLYLYTKVRTFNSKDYVSSLTPLYDENRQISKGK
jgi:uncharacterized lipoprotein YehR (DUF1307 family)